MRRSRTPAVPAVLLAALALAPPLPLAADEPAAAAPADTLAAAVRALRVGDRVVVTRASGERLRGRVASVEPLAVSPRAGAPPLALGESDVARLAVLRADSLWNGALIGLGVGASVVFAADCNSPGCDEVQPYAVAGVLALGVGIGALVDHLTRGEVVLYRAPREREGLALSIAPLVGRHARGARLTLRWGGRSHRGEATPRPRRPGPPIGRPGPGARPLARDAAARGSGAGG